MRPRDSAIVAVLINTRGLTELIALDLGLSAGLIDQRVFSILVLMALITTALTGPLLSLLPSPEVPPAVSEQHPAALPQADSSD
jgi:Kef-type K+ transport system membrane component KefB